MNLSFVNKFRSQVVFGLLAVMVTVISLTTYLSVQQNYRNNANDPQIDATEQIVELLNQGAPADAILGQSSAIDVAKSLSLFIIIFDKDAKPVSSTGKLDGNIPVPPKGVFDALKKSSESKFTWEMKKGVRVAGVIRKANDDKGYVFAGRSLREVEKRTMQLAIIVFIAWVILMLVSAFLAVVLSRLHSSLTLVENTEVILETKPEEKK